MILKQLKQLALSATRRNAHLLRFPRLYTSPAAVSETLTTATTTSKPCKRLTRDERRLVVESFVSKFREANAGKFPTVTAIVTQVGGGYYNVRNILQELKLRPNAPISQFPNGASSSLKQDHSIEASHSSSDEASLQGENSLVIPATHDTSETVTAPLDKDVDSKCDGSSTHLPDTEQPISQQLPASIANDTSPLQKDHTIESSRDEASVQGDNTLVTPATSDRSETVTASLEKDVDSKCDDGSSTHLPEIQTLAQIATQEPRADHLQGANVLANATHDKGETETDLPSTDVDSKCLGSSTHLPENQALKVADECLKSSETKDEGALTQSVSPEPKADHLEGASVLPVAHGNRETEIAPSNDDADSKRDATTHLPGSQKSKVSEDCIKNSETEEEGTLTHLASQEQKADCHEGGAGSANVLPTETRQVPEKEDGEAKTGENSSAWSNIVSFAKEFANFWRKG